MKLVAKITAVPLFEGLSAKQLEKLASIGVEQDAPRGRIVFSEGEEASGLFVVSAGRVKIFKLAPSGKEQILHVFGPGEPFGEAAVFAGRRFPAHALAVEPSRILFFPRPALLELIRENPDLALAMLGVLSLRLKRFTNMIEDLSLKEVPGRLAAYLLHLHRRLGRPAELELDMTKTELASLLGTMPETLSRILSKMVRQGLITLDGRRIRLLEPDELESLAASESRLSEV